MKAAVVARPSLSAFKRSPERIRAILNSFEIIYTFEEFGGKFISGEFNNTEKMPLLKSQNYVERFYEIAEILKEKKVDVLVTMGGDGIASYAASALIARGVDISIMGYPAGTANIGPIVRHSFPDDLFGSAARLDAIEVSCGNKVLGYGFNDVVFGSSLLGTINGKMVNVSAMELAVHARNMECIPAEKAVSPSFEMKLNEEKVELGMMKDRIAQICISTLHQDNLNGRAVMGGVAESQGYEHPAAVALLDKVSVDARPETWNSQALRITAHICFNEKDTIRLKGFNEDTCVMIDGNPFVITGDEVKVRCIPQAINVLGYRR